jgi:hypothetical protein
MPAGVTEIPEYTFFGCKRLNKVYFRDGLTAIGNSAFGSCESLTSVNLPSTLTSIGSDAFANCKKLSAVTIPDSVTTLGKQAFTNCHGLTEVTLSKNLKTIPQGAFILTGITSIDIPEGVTAIDSLAFYSCKSLTDVKLPSTLKTVGEKAFELTGGIKVTFGGSSLSWYSIDIDMSNKTLNNAPVTFEKQLVPPPYSVRVEYSEQYHQMRFTWEKVSGAEKYGIAVYLAGKWRIQTQNIPASATSYTSPKNMTPGMTYKVAVAAKVNGKWDIANAIKHAVTVTVK